MDKFFKQVARGILAGLLAVFFSAAAFAADELYLLRGGVTYVLVKTQALAGERYEASIEPGVVFESSGDSASLSFGREKISRYVLMRDRRDDEFILTADGKNYTMRRVVAASGAKYEADGDPSTVFWSKGSAAMLEIAGRAYADYYVWLPFGGIWLPDETPPAGVEWRVRSINGADVIEGSNVTLTFGANGLLHGTASVNNYTVPWMPVRNRLIIASPVSTRMMGPADLMSQEGDFLRTLADVKYFRPLKDGLELITNNGGSIILAR